MTPDETGATHGEDDILANYGMVGGKEHDRNTESQL